MNGPGKGDKWRKGTNFNKYRTNFDNISSTDIKCTIYKNIKNLKNGKIRYIYSD